MSGLRDALKRLAFAGLRPEVAAKLPLRERWRRRFNRFADRLAGHPAPEDDPLYQSNRSWRYNLKVMVYLALPLLLVLGFALFSTDRVSHKNKAATNAVPYKLTPDLYNGVIKASELEVAEIILEKKSDPAVVHGSVRNNSGQKFESAEISFNVTDKDGMLLGAVSTTVKNIPPHGSQEFTVPVPQKDAAIVLVRDAHRL